MPALAAVAVRVVTTLFVARRRLGAVSARWFESHVCLSSVDDSPDRRLRNVCVRCDPSVALPGVDGVEHVERLAEPVARDEVLPGVVEREAERRPSLVEAGGDAALRLALGAFDLFSLGGVVGRLNDEVEPGGADLAAFDGI